MMEATRFPEMLVFTRATRRHIPEDDILHSHRHEKLKFYALRGSLMKTRPEKRLDKWCSCVGSIACEFGRSHIGERGRPLAVLFCGRRHKHKDGLPEM
jgi:hypothetical protein